MGMSSVREFFRNNFVCLVPVVCLVCSLFSCSRTQYRIEVQLDSINNYNGRRVLLALDDGTHIDSTIISGNSFVLEGRYADSLSKQVAYLSMRDEMSLPLIIEPTTLYVKFHTQEVKGSELNGVLTQFNREVQAVKNNAIRGLNESYITTGSNTEEEVQRAGNTLKQSTQKYSDIGKQYLMRHPNDPIGIQAVVLLLSTNNHFSEEELSQIKSLMGDVVANNRRVRRLVLHHENYLQTQIGNLFTDFEGVTGNNQPIRLGDFVGKGKYTLIDFWSSWCKPCRIDINLLNKINEVYRSHRLQVVGVFVWDDPTNFPSVVELQKIAWPQILDVQDVSTDLYGIRGIPYNVIFAPDGTIVSRGLRGDDLVNKLDSIFSTDKGHSLLRRRKV